MQNSDDIRYVYSLSSVGDMFEEFLLSVKTLTKYVDEDQIIVYYTPPRNTKHEEIMTEFDFEVRKTENMTEAFSMTGFDNPQGYGEKIRCTEVESDTVVFLDCDTLVLRDINQVIQGDFDIKARKESISVSKEWERLFRERELDVKNWMPNTGFLIFKQGAHREIGEKWRNNLEQINTELEGVKHLEQYALALSTDKHSFSSMSEVEHTFGWVEEPKKETIVYHRDTSLNQSAVGELLEKINYFTPVDTRKAARKILGFVN